MKGLQTWKALSPRDRFLLKGLTVFVIGVLAFQVLWQPSRQRVTSVERHYQQQLALAQQVNSTQPQRALPVAGQPLASTINDSAEAAGLKVQQIEVQNEQLRLTLSGDAHALLKWLAELERDAGAFQTLTLEKRGSHLEARLVL